MPQQGKPVNTIGKQFSLLIKPASADCNLSCKYCFYYQRSNDPYNFRERHRMGDEVLKSMISQYLSLADCAYLLLQSSHLAKRYAAP